MRHYLRLRADALALRAALVLAGIFWIVPLQAFAQSQTELSLQDSLAALEKKLSEMQVTMEQMQAEIARLRAAGQPSQAPQAEVPAEKLQEDQDLLNAKIDEQYQTKVESASKYRVRLSAPFW